MGIKKLLSFKGYELKSKEEMEKLRRPIRFLMLDSFFIMLAGLFILFFMMILFFIL